jgi:hypothetical protein
MEIDKRIRYISCKSIEEMIVMLSPLLERLRKGDREAIKRYNKIMNQRRREHEQARS